MKALDGKIALVTGGARGVGRAICMAMADAGARVAVADLREDDARATASEVGGMAVAMNMADAASIATGVAIVYVEWGGIDILVNNAGIFNMASLDKVTHEAYRHKYIMNVGGAIFAAQAVEPSMKLRGGGVIINVASQDGRRDEPNDVLYCSIKAALISITQSLALELAKDNIRVNAIVPGVIDTPIWDVVDAQFAQYENKPIGQKKREVGEAAQLGRMGDPRDLASRCVFLASDAARYITAQTMNVDDDNKGDPENRATRHLTGCP